MMTKWNRDSIAKLLHTSDRAVERAIVAIYDRQTQDEKATSDTKHTNHRGFRSNHASKGSYYARWVNSGRRLSGFHLENARKIALHYTRQLAEIADARNAKRHECNGDLTQDDSKFEKNMELYMRTTKQSREDAERVVRNVMAGKCPDGCCGSGECE
jgi:hypothetical protein